jgi:hypothetical protein
MAGPPFAGALRTALVVPVAASNLFAVASARLGDATQWNRIAALNGLTDPWITTGLNITLPPVNANAGNGGILGV